MTRRSASESRAKGELNGARGVGVRGGVRGGERGGVRGSRSARRRGATVAYLKSRPGPATVRRGAASPDARALSAVRRPTPAVSRSPPGRTAASPTPGSSPRRRRGRPHDRGPPRPIRDDRGDPQASPSPRSGTRLRAGRGSPGGSTRGARATSRAWAATLGAWRASAAPRIRRAPQSWGGRLRSLSRLVATRVPLPGFVTL